MRVYRDDADGYDALVSAEDCDGNLGPALEAALGPLEGLKICEVGAGTGRLTRALVGRGAHVDATDAAPAMLEVARRHLAAHETARWTLGAADARALPFPDAGHDAAVAGWVLGHFNSWFGDAWQTEVSRALEQMQRVVKPEGRLVIIETLGTGAERPCAPSEALARYYGWLEAEGFIRSVVATDYRFGSVEAAAETCGHFFGEELAARVRARGWARVPEWTGVWSR